MNENELMQRLAQLEAQVALLARDAVGGEATPDPLENHAEALAEALEALAPVRALLDDPSVNDVLINGPKAVYVERAGKLEKTDLTFSAESTVFDLAQKIAAQTGRTVTHRRPLADARLMDGSRVNVIAPPLAVDGTAISIRKFSTRDITLSDMAGQLNMSAGLAEFLRICGKCKLNIIISGGTGSGKTTLLNAISRHISADERIVTIEDAAELRLQQPHVVRLETRPLQHGGNPEEEYTIRDLMKNALRMRPDRIIIGEVRGAEAFDMMQAMNTGHEGSLTSIHANHPRDALARLENMVTMTNFGLPSASIKTQIASAVQLVVQVSRMRDGHRRIAYVSEIVGMESDIITMQDLFVFVPKGEGADGRLQGEFKWTGIVPRFTRRIAYYGEADALAKALGTVLPKF
jgi:pilus assembly protein CpaF